MKYININRKYILFCVLSILFLLTFVSPVSANEIGPGHDLIGDDDGLDVDVEVAENENGDKLTKNASMTFNVTVKTQNAKDTYPYIYPIDINITENSESIDTQTVFLSPTTSDNYTPSYGDNENRNDYELKEDFELYLAFDDQFDDDVSEDNYLDRNLNFKFESRYTDDKNETSDIYSIEGTTPNGRSSIDSSINSISGYDEISSTTHVDRYRIQDSDVDAGYLEDYSIPYKDTYTGDVERFYNMRNTDDGTALLRSNEDGFKMLTNTRNVPRGEPQTIAITYNLFQGEELTIDPVESDGSSIDPDTEYVLPEDPEDSEYCRSISSSNNLCLFALSNEEVDTLNNLGESYLEYDSNGEDISAELFCQGIISGYFSNEESTCGNSAIVDSDLIQYSEFKSLPENEDEYMSEVVPLNFFVDDIQQNEINVTMKTNILSNLENDDDVTVESSIVREEGIDTNSIDTDDVIDTSEVTLDNSEEEGNNISWTIKKEDILDEYVAVICESGTVGSEDCTAENNIDKTSLIFSHAGPPGNPNVRVKSPIRIDLEESNSEKEEYVTERLQTQTTDDTYLDNNPDWYEVENKKIDNFTGEISETIILENKESADASDYESEASDKLSDISPEGSWDTTDYNSDIVGTESESRYVSSSESLDKPWNPVSAHSERVAQTGTKSEYFDVNTGAEFASITNSEEGWYRDRTENAINTPVEDNKDTKIQHEDPDDCYNCLYAESLEEAENRFNNTVQENLISSPDGENYWTRVSDEPYDIATLDENDVEFRESNSDLSEGYTKVYEGEDGEKDIWRRASYDEREIYEWERQSEIPQLKFNAPVNEEIRKWEATWSDISYEYTGEIEEPTDLYTYQKDIEVEITEWENETVWYEFSGSEVSPKSSGKSLDTVSVSYEGQSTDYNFDWVDEVHSRTPTQIGQWIESGELCEDEPVENEIAGGSGGVGIVEECTPNDRYAPNVPEGEKIVTRIGKSYNEEGQFNPEIKIRDNTGQAGSETIDVNVNEGPGTPEFEVDSIPEDNKFDYNIDQIAFNGTISSQTSALDKTYELVVSPADSFSGIEGCPEGYEADTEYNIQRETQTTDTYEEIEKCDAQFRDDLDESELPNEFERYAETEDGNVTKYDFEAGSIQNCDSEVFEDGDSDGECNVPSDDNSNIDSDKTITYNTGSEYQSVEGDYFDAEYCPIGYNLNEKTNDGVTEATCELDGDSEFDLKTRQVNVDYTQIQNRVVEKCSDIPTSSETYDHDGYENTASNDDQNCELVDKSHPGPIEFTLYDSEIDQYYTPPSGAVRGNTLIDNEDSVNRCESFNINKNTFECEYDTINSEDTTTIDYAEFTKGEWNYHKQALDKLPDSNQNSNDVIWSSDYILHDENTTDNPQEKFTALINPREMPIDSEDWDNINEFEFTLQPKDGDSNAYTQTETVEVDMCKEKSYDNLPREEQGEACEDFDTLSTGSDDYNSTRQTISDAMSKFNDGEPGDGPGGEYIIESVINDACPYHIKYPYEPDNISPLNVEINEQTTRNELEREVYDYLISRYGQGDSLCSERDEDPNDPNNGGGGTSTGDDEDKTRSAFSIGESYTASYNFNTESFRNSDKQDNVRRIGANEIDALQDIPTVSNLAPHKYGNTLRLGTPVYNNKSNVNGGLIAMYTFDHDPEDNYYQIDGTLDGNINNGPGPDYKITDIYDAESLNKLDDTLVDMQNTDETTTRYIYPSDLTSETNFETEKGSHHARLWYGNPCNPYQNDIVYGIKDFNTAFDDYGMDCYDDIQNRNETKETFKQVDGEWESTINSDIFEKQTAFLPREPSYDTKEYIENNPINTYTYDTEDQYGTGTFGSNSLSLDDTSWLMLSPPCIDEENIGEIDSGITGGECTYEGGYKGLYLKTGDDGLSNNMPDESLDEKLADNEYTISFNVKQKNEPTSEPGSLFAEGSDRPIRQLIGLSRPKGQKSRYSYQTSFLSTMTWNSTLADNPERYSLQSSWESDTEGVSWPINSNEWNDEYLVEESSYEENKWSQVVLTAGEVNGEDVYRMYLDGEKIYDNRYESVGVTIDYNGIKSFPDEGKIYEDSVISIGAGYVNPEYETMIDGTYVPRIQASAGEIDIDEVRVYNKSVSDMDYTVLEDGYSDISNTQVGWLMQEKDYTSSTYDGSIESAPQNVDSMHRNISTLTSRSKLNINIDYDSNHFTNFNLNVIPCENEDGNSCDEDSAIEISELELDDGSIDAYFPDKARDNFDEIEYVKLKYDLHSYNIEDTPVIRDTTINVEDNPYQTCQGAYYSTGDNGNYSKLGKSEITLLSDNYQTVDTNCDMDTEGGGWTQFYWAEEGAEYEHLTLDENSTLSDCELSDGACFSPAKFDIIEVFDKDNYPEHMDIEDEDDLKPQILIKSIDGNNESYAAIELTNMDRNEVSSDEDEELLIESPDDDEAVTFIEGYFDGSLNLDTENGIPISEDNCLSAFATSSDYDMDNNCINSGIFNDNDFYIESNSAEHGQYQHIDINRNEDTVEHVECLGNEEADRCEVYYRLGSAY